MARRKVSDAKVAEAPADEAAVGEDDGPIELDHDTNLPVGEGTGEDGLFAPTDQNVRMTAEYTVGPQDEPHVPTESALENGRLADRDDPRR